VWRGKRFSSHTHDRELTLVLALEKVEKLNSRLWVGLKKRFPPLSSKVFFLVFAGVEVEQRFPGITISIGVGII